MENGLKPTLEAQILHSNVKFANDLYHILAKKEGNLIFSPISVHAVLSMLYQGSHGDTSYTLAHTLRNRSAKSTAEGYKLVMERLNTPPNNTFSFNHKIYVPKHQTEIRKEFENTLMKNFLTEVELINFGKPKAAAATINKWATTTTKAKMSPILHKRKLKGNLGIMGISAVFFDGDWVTQFSKKFTKTLKFFINKEKSIPVKIMYQKTKLLYKHDDQLQAQIVEIPYKNDNFKMLIILPFESSSVGDLETKLAATNLEELRKNLQMKEVNLYLPKFKMESTLALSDILCEIGLSSIFFEDRANFKGLTEQEKSNICVGDIIQKVCIKVNEKGDNKKLDIGNNVKEEKRPGMLQTVTFKVDRPAVFLILSSHNDIFNILLFGRLSCPQY